MRTFVESLKRLYKNNRLTKEQLLKIVDLMLENTRKLRLKNTII